MPGPRHPELSAKVCGWMIALADPIALQRIPSERLAAADISRLIEAASLHAVRSAAVRNLRNLVAAEGHRRVVGDDEGEAALHEAFAQEDKLRSAQTRTEAMLAKQGDRIVRVLADKGIHSLRAKGDVFARRLYPHALDRPFGDIDVLVAAEDLDKTKPIVAGLGFRLDFSDTRGGQAYRLDKWIFERDETVEVEIQANLIHSRKLGSAVGMSYEELLAAGDGNAEDASALLLVGAVHGAAVHQFDRLQHVVDVLQAVRGTAGEIDIERLKRAAHRTGATAGLQTALDITAAMFDEPRSHTLADQLSAPWRGARSRLLTPGAVMRARSTARGRDSWRRRLLRAIIKTSGRYERRQNALA